MKVNSYSFGSMTIDGEQYRDDLMLVGGSIKTGWYRKNGHLLVPEDLEWIISQEPSHLVIGTGSSGRMKVPEKTLKFLSEHGVKAEVSPTSEAVEKFNRREEEMKDPFLLSGAFHLTC